MEVVAAVTKSVLVLAFSREEQIQQVTGRRSVFAVPTVSSNSWNNERDVQTLARPPDL